MTDYAVIARTVTRAAQINAEIKALTEEYNNLLDSLGTLEPRNYPAGDYILQVSPNVRFDEATAKRALSPEQFESILKRKPDSTLAKAVLDEETYKKTQKNYGVRRTIKRVEDA